MKVLAFLQNSWFHNPVQAKRLFDSFPFERHHELHARFLFAGCKSGAMLKRFFGKQLCEQILWENASPRIGGQSQSAFPADPTHMHRVMTVHKPKIVICFGRIAQDGWRLTGALHPTDTAGIYYMIAPHPAARGNGVAMQLRMTAASLKEVMSKIN